MIYPVQIKHDPRKDIRLYGHLRARFGTSFRLAVSSPAEAIRALCATIPGFRQAIEEYEPGFRVRSGRESLGDTELNRLGDDTIRIVPCIVGAKSEWGQILVGAALLVAAYFTGGTSLAWSTSILTGMGTSMVLGGVGQLLAGNPSYSQSALDKGPADTPSYAFSGPHMTTGQGNPVPLGYGKMRVSGALVSLGISPETWTVKGLGAAAPDEIGTMGGNGDTTPWIWAIAPSA